MGTRRLEVVISGDASSLNRALGGMHRGLGQAETASQKFSRQLGSLARAGALAGAALVGATAGLGVRELIEGEKAAARTANVIKTTGGAANVTAQQVADLSSEIQALTGSEDDQVQAAANVLLTFKQIRNEAGATNDIFDQSVAITNDFAVAMGKDLNSAALMVGKALNDPIRGATQLRRAGVQLTEQQEEQIRAFVESGNVLGAQKIILAELQSQFGGAAASEGEMTEATQRAQRQFEDLAEGLAARVLPALVSLGGFVSDNGDTLVTIAGVATAAGAAMLTYAGALKVVAAAQAVSQISSKGLFAALSVNPAALGLTAAAAAALGIAYLALRDNVTYTDDAMAQLRAGAQSTADAHRQVADAVNAQKDALDRLNGANLSVRESRLRLEEATARAAEAERDYGRGSVEHRRALLDLERAQQAVTTGRREQIKAARQGIDTTKESSTALQAEVRATQRRLAEAQRAKLLFRDSAEVQRQLTAAERAAGQASATAAAKHRDNAQRALEMANQTGGATREARELRAGLRALAAQEFSLAAHAQAMSAVTSAASSATAGVNALAAALARAAAAPRPRGAGSAASAAPSVAGFDGAQVRNATGDDPTERDFYDARVVQAALTADTGDDLAAAHELATFLGHQYNAAVASGDPRRVVQAGRDFQGAKDSLQSLIDALNRNSEATETQTTATEEQTRQSFGGSVVLGYRNQGYVLPSSDRLEGFL